MNVNNTNSLLVHSEPLYLLLEDNNKVSVNNFLLEQHQIDGLRFLFKQFIKKSPGVIVNFPASCGKSATVAIFLNAVSGSLKNPVLVLCQGDAEIEYWMSVLLKWSSCGVNDVSVESLNPFIKGKKVFLKKRENLNSYLRRKWSIIILKENEVNKDVFKLSFEADFKICITSTDIKKDYVLLSAVFHWLYPKPKVNINNFIATKEDGLKDKYRKSVQLDLILEDVAIRQYHNMQPFETKKPDNITQTETNVMAVEANHRKGSIKNKDATGTKIKRSKIPKDNNATTSDDNYLLHDHNISDQKIISNPIFMNTVGNNVVSINEILDKQALNKISSHSDISINERKVEEPKVLYVLKNKKSQNKTSKPNILGKNNNIVKESSNKTKSKKNDESLLNKKDKKHFHCDRISSNDSPIINISDDSDTDFIVVNDIKDENIDNAIHNESKNVFTEEHDSIQLDVENFIREQDPIEACDDLDKLSSLLEKESINKLSKCSKTDDYVMDKHNKTNLDDKDLLKEQLMQSLHIDDSENDINEIIDLDDMVEKETPPRCNFDKSSSLYEVESKNKLSKSLKVEDYVKVEKYETTDLGDKNHLKEQLMQSLQIDDSKDKIDLNKDIVKEETSETGSLIFDNNSEINLTEIKDLRNQLIESLGFESNCEVIIDTVKKSEIKNDSNQIEDIRNKSLLQKQLIESLVVESKNLNDSDNTAFDSKGFDQTLLKEESAESLSFNSNSNGKQNNIKDSDRNVKVEYSESLNFGSNSKVDLNEMNDLRNKNILQKQLIESLGLDDQKVEIKDEEKDDAIGVNENIQAVVKQSATNSEYDETIIVKVETELGHATNSKVNVSNKRKSDASDKDLDNKILEMEEKALKKFKGSFLDSIF